MKKIKINSIKVRGYADDLRFGEELGPLEYKVNGRRVVRGEKNLKRIMDRNTFNAVERLIHQPEINIYIV